MSTTGRCHCGAVRWSAEGPPEHHAVCHCEDCRRWSGAPLVGWIAWQAERVTVDGSTTAYRSSQHGAREFCGTCGTGLFYTNALIFPDQIDVQTATLDEPSALPLQAQIQTAERIGWMADLEALPQFERYPGP